MKLTSGSSAASCSKCSAAGLQLLSRSYDRSINKELKHTAACCTALFALNTIMVKEIIKKLLGKFLGEGRERKEANDRLTVCW